MFIKEISNRCVNDEQKQNKLACLKHKLSKIKNRLKTVSLYFPHFSCHDESHSINIMEHISVLLGSDTIAKFSLTDLMLFTLACYSHDLGMSLRYEAIHDFMDTEEWKEGLLQYIDSKNIQQEDVAVAAVQLLRFKEQGILDANIKPEEIYIYIIQAIESNFRNGHGRRSYDEILKDEDFRELLGYRVQRHLADICLSHEQSVDKILDLPYEDNGIFYDYCHPRFIAVLLCLGDLLDMDTERFDKNIIAAASPMPNLSEIHRKKHESVRKLHIANAAISIKADCESFEVYREMRKWVQWIKDICTFAACNWNLIVPGGFCCPPYFAQEEILLNGNKKWLKYANTRLNINSEKALAILQGSGIYNDKFIFIRELIQNAVDATVIKIYNDWLETHDACSENELLDYLVKLADDNNNSGFMPFYCVEGFIEIKNKQVKVEIRDHGIGISDDDIERIANLTGKSVAKKKLIESMPNWFRPSGAFSLGLQSIFNVSKSFEMITKSANEPGKSIRFDELKNESGYLTIEDKPELKIQGTTVIVYLDNDKFNQADLNQSDFYYKTEPKESLIYKRIMLYFEKYDRFQERQQEYEYVPVCIYAFDYKHDNKQLKLLEYKSMFKKKCFKNKGQYYNICFKYGVLNYEAFDFEQGCIYECTIDLCRHTGHIYGKLSDAIRHRAQDDTLYYRNVYVKNEFKHTYSISGDILEEYMVSKLNIISGSADNILTINRNDIRKEYLRTLDKLKDQQNEKMIKRIVDFLVNEHSFCTEDVNDADILFVLYQASLNLDYKTDEFQNKFKDELSKINVGNYWYGKDGEPKESVFKLTELKDKRITVAVELEDLNHELYSADLIPNEFCEKDNIENCYNSNHKKIDRHILNHSIEKEYIFKDNGKVYHAYVLIPLISNNNFIFEKSKFFVLRQMLHILFGNLRCMDGMPNYESLCTPVDNGLYYIKRNIAVDMIEMSMDDALRAQICKELQDNGYIKDCAERYIEKVVKSSAYTENIKYITEYKLNSFSGIDGQETQIKLEKLYKKLWEEALGTLENEHAKEFVLREINNITSYCDIRNYGWYSRELPRNYVTGKGF